MAQHVAPEVSKSLWERVAARYRAHLQMFIVNPGMKADRKAGKSAKDVTFETVLELTEAAYREGLEQGYDMGHSIAKEEAGDAAG
jgi:hypothetical protein